jgi:hypothetical protein
VLKKIKYNLNPMKRKLYISIFFLSNYSLNRDGNIHKFVSAFNDQIRKNKYLYDDFFFVWLSIIVKVRLFVGIKWSMGSWIRGFKHYRQQSMDKLCFVGYLFSCFKWTMKSANIITPRLIMISQYCLFVYQLAIVMQNQPFAITIKKKTNM